MQVLHCIFKTIFFVVLAYYRKRRKFSNLERGRAGIRKTRRASGTYLLVEHWLGLTTETRLFAIVTSLTLSPETLLTLLVLGDLLRSVLLATLAIGVSLLRDVDLLKSRA